jgi:hypothetical protein
MSEQSVRPEMVQRSARSRVSKAPAQTFAELGVTGLRQYGGFVAEEWLRQLSGRRAMLVWREMADNDATVGALLFAVEMLARGVECTLEEGSDPAAAELIEECRNDMADTWEDFISEVLTMLISGWSLHEECFKRRLGPEPKGKGPDGKPLPPSRYNDGKIGWSKLPIRAQETLSRWNFDDNGDVKSMEQQPPTGGPRTIAMEKALLFRTTTKKGNPEGRSILRNSYVAWYRKKNIEEIEAIGIERDLAGIPVATPPENFDIMAAENKDTLDAAQEMVTTIRRDEDEGVVLPAGWTLELLTTGGSRQLDPDKVIRRYRLDIATTILADMLLTGQDRVGTYSMMDIKSQIFGAAVDTWLDAIAAVLNRYAIPRLLRLNGMSVDDPPKITFGTTRQMDLEAVGQMLQTLTLAGAVVFPDNDLLAALFSEMGLPAPAAVEAEKAEGGPSADIPPLGQAYITDGRLLEGTLHRQTQDALRDFGEEAATAYERIARKEATPDDRRAADQVLGAIGLAGFARKLARGWHEHYGRVADKVVTTFKDSLEAEGRTTDIGLTRNARAQILRDGGLRVGMLDIQKQLTDSIYRALADARESKEGWKEASDRIRRYVPAGKFIKAGAGYRSQLIARTETGNAQRRVALAAYEAHPEVAKVELLDGLLADSDEHCKERNGDHVSFEDARHALDDEHPNGTLQLLPVFEDAL